MTLRLPDGEPGSGLGDDLRLDQFGRGPPTLVGPGLPAQPVRAAGSVLLGRVDGVTDRLRELSAELDDRLLHAFAAQADAAACGSGERLDDVASEFSELGAQALAEVEGLAFAGDSRLDRLAALHAVPLGGYAEPEADLSQVAG